MIIIEFIVWIIFTSAVIGGGIKFGIWYLTIYKMIDPVVEIRKDDPHFMDFNYLKSLN